jgi:hypothetical protein
MAQAVSHRPLTAEARILVQIGPCGICGRESGTETGLSPISSFSPVSMIPPELSILIYHLGDEQ